MTATAHPLERTEVGASFLVDAFLLSYGQILFSRSRVVGVLLCASTLFAPKLFLAGAAAVLLSLLVTRALGLSPDLTRAGFYGFNALLVGLGAAAVLDPGWTALLFGVVAVAACVLVTAAVHSALWQAFNVPSLTLPFLFVFYILYLAAPSFGISISTEVLTESLQMPDRIGAPVDGYLRSLGALFFLPRPDAGAVILLALIVFSRIGVLLSFLGFAVACGASALLAPEMWMAADFRPLMLGYNCMLVSIALGGIWFVPSPSSFFFALTGAVVCAMITIGIMPLLGSMSGLPVLILPFNVTVILLLYAMRQRVRDGRPKAVDFLLGTPEQNLTYFRTRLARFGARYFLRFHAPFLGRWICTQGVEGKHTHKGPWRHALDFEVEEKGERFRGRGEQLKDHHCYRLPVYAPADGTVVKVQDGVPDNDVGETNLKENWGNLVLLVHAPGIYSAVCHLAPDSIKLREGDFVKQGDRIGLCGNSGRSPVPHLHFQLQGTARVGAPTMEIELHDVVSCGDGEQL
ncbi:MAG: urea transporter, partial [Planctomycetota bacterium]